MHSFRTVRLFARCGGRRIAALHFVTASGRHIFGQLAAHGPHEGDDLPHLLIGNFAAERRHPIRPTLNDVSVDVLRLTSIDPGVVHQRRTNAASTVKVAAGTVVRVVQLLAFGDGIGVIAIRILHPLRRRLIRAFRRIGRVQAANRESRCRATGRRRLAEAPVLTLACGQRQQEKHANGYRRFPFSAHRRPFPLVAWEVRGRDTPGGFPEHRDCGGSMRHSLAHIIRAHSYGRPRQSDR